MERNTEGLSEDAFDRLPIMGPKRVEFDSSASRMASEGVTAEELKFECNGNLPFVVVVVVDIVSVLVVLKLAVTEGGKVVIVGEGCVAVAVESFIETRTERRRPPGKIE